jgi:GT2 family glycosyltransferase
LALMQDGYLGFMNQNHRIEDNAGYLGSLECGYDYSAVLGACQMVSKKLFDSLGGYCEDLAITYNDVDFCWRIREQGKLVIYTPYVQFYHYEFASRSRDNADESHAIQTEYEAGLMRMKWPRYFALGDPCLPPNCSKNSPCFKLG